MSDFTEVKVEIIETEESASIANSGGICHFEVVPEFVLGEPAPRMKQKLVC